MGVQCGWMGVEGVCCGVVLNVGGSNTMKGTIMIRHDLSHLLVQVLVFVMMLDWLDQVHMQPVINTIFSKKTSLQKSTPPSNPTTITTTYNTITTGIIHMASYEAAETSPFPKQIWADGFEHGFKTAFHMNTCLLNLLYFCMISYFCIAQQMFLNLYKNSRNHFNIYKYTVSAPSYPPPQPTLTWPQTTSSPIQTSLSFPPPPTFTYPYTSPSPSNPPITPTNTQVYEDYNAMRHPIIFLNIFVCKFGLSLNSINLWIMSSTLNLHDPLQCRHLILCN